MVHSPSKKWENGVLVERALSVPADGEPEEVEPKATRPYKTPLPTASEVNRKRISASDDVENKAVKKATKKASKS